MPSVQQTLEEAIEAFCGQPVRLYVAGRTDAGVHALRQVAHVDLPKEYETDTVLKAVNFHLYDCESISVLHVEKVAADFHARFDAKKRSYEYHIVNRQSRLALDRKRAWHVRRPLDIGRMQKAADLLIGQHDFSTFRATHCQAKSPIKTMDKINIASDGNLIIVSLKATSFLHHQVRNIVGTLELVGAGKWTVDIFKQALEARDRTKGGPTAPAHGLYLTTIEY